MLGVGSSLAVQISRTDCHHFVIGDAGTGDVGAIAFADADSSAEAGVSASAAAAFAIGRWC